EDEKRINSQIGELENVLKSMKVLTGKIKQEEKNKKSEESHKKIASLQNDLSELQKKYQVTELREIEEKLYELHQRKYDLTKKYDRKLIEYKNLEISKINTE